jgi:hypothetical protein
MNRFSLVAPTMEDAAPPTTPTSPVSLSRSPSQDVAPVPVRDTTPQATQRERERDRLTARGGAGDRAGHAGAAQVGCDPHLWRGAAARHAVQVRLCDAGHYLCRGGGARVAQVPVPGRPGPVVSLPPARARRSAHWCPCPPPVAAPRAKLCMCVCVGGWLNSRRRAAGVRAAGRPHGHVASNRPCVHTHRCAQAAGEPGTAEAAGRPVGAAHLTS